ncbi:MAG: hypothetical protein RR268_04780 [Kiritimatiellia bacterium]
MISKRFTFILQVFILVALVVMGLWVRCYRIAAPIASTEEVGHLFAVAQRIETPCISTIPPEVKRSVTPFHVFAAKCVEFMSEETNFVHVRYYRLVPLALTLLFLPLWLGLGLRRRGGLYETADGLFWTVAFAAAMPFQVLSAGTFTPSSLLTLAFLAFLVAIRAYAQWPGYASAIAVGAFCAFAISLDPSVVWVIVAFLPAVFIGVGWRWLCLYWRTLHVLLGITVGVGLWTIMDHFGWIMPFRLPVIPSHFSAELLYRILCLGGGGLGFIAWLGVTIWAFIRSDRRFARVISIAFLMCFWGSLFFAKGGPFAEPLAGLSLLLMGLALSAIPAVRIRWILGNATLAFLCIQLFYTLTARNEPFRAVQEAARTSALQTLNAPRCNALRLRILSHDPKTVACLLWTLRASLTDQNIQWGADFYDDADILAADETLLELLPVSVSQRIRPGRYSLTKEEAYRFFALPPKESFLP